MAIALPKLELPEYFQHQHPPIDPLGDGHPGHPGHPSYVNLGAGSGQSGKLLFFAGSCVVGL